jgi:large subunit ribosomal protein L5
MKILTAKEKQATAFEHLKEAQGYKNAMQAPKFTKVVINVGIGSLKDKKKIETIVDRLTKISGQKPALRGSKKSIAAFKVRQGDPVGLTVTLRGARMFSFIDKLVFVAFPRTKDFRGLSKKGIDEMGNYSIGIKENTIFSETADEDLKDVFGMTITVGTTANNKKEAQAFLSYIGFPFKKEEVEEKKEKKEKKEVKK